MLPLKDPPPLNASSFGRTVVRVTFVGGMMLSFVGCLIDVRLL